MIWSANPHQTHHEGFEKPIYAWVPSIGISQLTVLGGKAFPQWDGDLMVSSLVAQSLFRVRLGEGQAVLVEAIPIGHGIRDLAELSNGAIALKTDDDLLGFLRANRRHPSDRSRSRGSRQGHRSRMCWMPFAYTGRNRWNRSGALGHSGTEVASRKGFAYSPALTSMSGTWTRDRLRAFISNPDSVAPGTQMELTATYESETLDDLMAFLETLR